MRHLIQSRGEFEELKEIAELLTIPESCFPPNCMAWVGASLLSSLNNEVDRFLLTFEDYKDINMQIPDRFGQAFLLGSREGNYFNKDFEENLKI
jgi:hypothetical protein